MIFLSIDVQENVEDALDLKSHSNHTKLDIEKMAYEFREFFRNICNITVTLIIWRNRSKITDIVKVAFKFLRNEDKRNLFILTVLILLLHGFDRSIRIFYIVMKYKISLKEGLPPGFLFKIINDSNAWNSVIFGLYITLTRIVDLAERNKINSMASKIMDKDARTVVMHVRQFLDLKDKIMTSLSVIPCFTFVYLVVRSVVAIIRMQNTRETLASGNRTKDTDIEALKSVTNLIGVILVIIEIVVMAFLTNNQCKKSQETLESLETSIILKHGLSCTWATVIYRIDQAKRYEFLVWDLFSINKQLLLSFCSAFVTFTVLFVQLINQAEV